MVVVAVGVEGVGTAGRSSKTTSSSSSSPPGRSTSKRAGPSDIEQLVGPHGRWAARTGQKRVGEAWLRRDQLVEGVGRARDGVFLFTLPVG